MSTLRSLPAGTKYALALLLFLVLSILTVAVVLVSTHRAVATPEAEAPKATPKRELQFIAQKTPRVREEQEDDPQLLQLDPDDVDATVRHVLYILGRLRGQEQNPAAYRKDLKQCQRDARLYVGKEIRWKMPVIVARESRVTLEDRFPQAMLGRIWSGLFITTSPHANAALPPGLRVPTPSPLQLQRGELCAIRAKVSEVILEVVDDPASQAGQMMGRVKVVLEDVQLSQ